MKRLLSRLLNRGLEAVLITIVVSGLLAAANQASLFSPTTGTVSGLNLTNNLNSAIDALGTCNSGASAPANQLSGSPALGNCWIDTSVSPKRLRRYDGTSWLILGAFDDTNHIWVPITGGGSVQSIASATTTDLCSANNNFATYVSITGTVTIQSFGSNCATGQIKTGVFTGILTLTHNASSFILPFNGANKTTAAGDTFTAVHLGSGNWRLLPYQNATGSPTIAAPTVQKFTSGTAATYTPTSGTVRIKVRISGGGGGAGAVVTNNGTTGNTTTFGSWTAIGGGGGSTGPSFAGGTGGTGGATGTGTLVVRIDGGDGNDGGQSATAGVFSAPGSGGTNPFGGAGRGGPGGAGISGKANTGAGGGGANNGASSNSSGGGGAGEYVEFWVNGPSATTYTVGTTAAGGAAGTFKGGDGAAGIIIIEEFYW